MEAIVAQFAFATALPVVASIALWLLRKNTSVAKLSKTSWSVIVGVVFGAIAVYGTEAGIPLDGAMMNVRDAAPLAAGLFFSGPAGIIAGVIGAVERWLSVMWGVGEFTRVACSLGTLFAGVYAALLRKYIFDDRMPSWPMAFASGVVVEVLHLLLVFLTNLDRSAQAFAIVQKCALPMILCVSASILVTALAFALLNKRPVFVPRSERGVAQIVQNQLLIAIVAAFFVTVGFMSVVQTNLARSDAASLLNLNIQDVKSDIVDASDANLLAITHHLAALLPSAAFATNEDCARLAHELDVAEVNVIDNHGIIVASNVPEFIGFDMSSGEQSREFLVLLPGGGKTEVVQSYQPIAYDASAKRKYAGVAVASGFVQVGYDADNFLDDIAVQVHAAVKNRHVGTTGELVVVDETGSVMRTAGGNSADENGRFAQDAEAAGPEKLFSTVLGGQACYAMYEQVEGYSIVGILPVAEANASRDVAVLIISFMEVVIFAALFLVMYFAIKRVVVRNIWQVNGQLGQITQGNLDVEVNVRESSEFSSLSDDINKTVGVLKDSLSAVQSDLDMAADIQANTLPSITPTIAGYGSFTLHASMEPAKEVGGDFYDFFLVDKDHLALVVADVSGKGVPAALFMMLSKTIIKMEALSGCTPDEVLLRANTDLVEKNNDDMFTTAWFGVLEISTGTLVYADAGHEKLALYRNGAWELPPKPNSAVALAAFDQEDYADLPERFHFRTHTVRLAPGDAIFQYTDGVTEATNAEDELFGEERLLDALRACASANPQEVLPFVHEQIDAFVGDAPQFDDITMLGLRYVGNNAGAEAESTAVDPA